MPLKVIAAALVLHAFAFGADSAGTKVFKVDTTHTVLGFKASTLLFDVPGRFDKYKAEIQGDPAAPGDAKVRLELEAASVDTANKTRDNHLRSEDFFNVAKFPKITFTSTQVRKAGDQVVVHGTLELHGHTMELDLPFQAASGMNGAGKATWSYRATVPLDRLAFGLGAESVAAKISLKQQVELDLLLVGFFEEPAAAPKGKH
jgi:polyisoprenoid-binding protein YceI